MLARNKNHPVGRNGLVQTGRLIRTALWGGLCLLLAALLGGWLLSALKGVGGKALPVYSVLPDFSMTERSGRPLTLAALRGKVWVADFFFSHCKDFCPLQTAEMARLQNDFTAEKDFRLVSFTIDPDRDSLEALKVYADRYRADPIRWLFLRGDRKETHDLVKKGFRLGIAISDEFQPRGDPQSSVIDPKNRPADTGTGKIRLGLRRMREFFGRFGPPAVWAHHQIEGDSKFTHSSRFVLVDRKAAIRGYYHSDAPDSLKRIRRDVKRLLSS